MRQINIIRGFGGGLLVPPLICNRPSTGGRYIEQWTCDPSDQYLFSCREATPADTDPESWALTGCGRALSAATSGGGGSGNATVTAPEPGAPPRSPQAAPPAVNIVNERMLAEERARILANQNRMEEERLARLRLQEEERQRQAVRQEQERQRLAELERQRLAAEQEQARIQAELERNRQQQALRQGTGSTGTPAPAETKTAGSFPWWLLGLLLLQ